MKRTRERERERQSERDVKILQIRMRCDMRSVCVWSACMPTSHHRRQRPHFATKSNISCGTARLIHARVRARVSQYLIVISHEGSSTLVFGCSVSCAYCVCVCECDWDWRCRRHFGNNLSDSLFLIHVSSRFHIGCRIAPLQRAWHHRPPSLPPPMPPPPPQQIGPWIPMAYSTIWKTDANIRPTYLSLCVCVS